jgi:hypothetical protein
MVKRNMQIRDRPEGMIFHGGFGEFCTETIKRKCEHLAKFYANRTIQAIEQLVAVRLQDWRRPYLV